MGFKTARGVQQQIDNAREALEQGKETARELSHVAVHRSREVAAHTDEWVRDNSWKLLAAAVAFGLALGLLMRASDDRTPERIPR